MHVYIFVGVPSYVSGMNILLMKGRVSGFLYRSHYFSLLAGYLVVQMIKKIIDC